MDVKRAANAAGWGGLLLIHGATLPVTVTSLLGGVTDLPPLSMVAMIWLGLFLFLVKAVSDKDTLYIASNGVGFALQSALLSLILFRG
jgi:hypothetical protein